MSFLKKLFQITSIYTFIIILIKKTKQECRIWQECDVTDPECVPRAADITNKSETTPRFNYTSDNLCPDYNNYTGACCSPTQVTKLKQNLDSLDSVFGSNAGGCDICVENLKRMWCHFTCSPDQDKFLAVGGIHDRIIDNTTHHLLDVNFTVEANTSCELYKSCKKVKFVSQVPSMGSSLGLLNFQGLNAYQKMPIYILMYQNNSNGVKFDIDTCDTEPVDGYIRGFKAQKCTCNNCYSNKLCDYDNNFTTAVMEGLNWVTLIVVYLVVFILTIVIFFGKKYCSKKNSNSSYDDDEAFNKRTDSINQ